MNTPTRFTSRPASCEAVQFDPAVGHPAVERRESPTEPGRFFDFIKTRQGYSGIDAGDWIITEPDGAGFYPCKRDIFEARWSPPNGDDEVPWADDLEKLGFEFSESDTMYLPCGVNNRGPQVVVVIEGNSWRDDYGLARSLSLFWTVSCHPTKVSGTYSICDNPTLGQIKALVAALKGE